MVSAPQSSLLRRVLSLGLPPTRAVSTSTERNNQYGRVTQEDEAVFRRLLGDSAVVTGEEDCAPYNTYAAAGLNPGMVSLILGSSPLFWIRLKTLLSRYAVRMQMYMVCLVCHRTAARCHFGLYLKRHRSTARNSILLPFPAILNPGETAASPSCDNVIMDKGLARVRGLRVGLWRCFRL